ncbi:unnamed protein product, partial [Pleuronectes platessa]
IEIENTRQKQETDRKKENVDFRERSDSETEMSVIGQSERVRVSLVLSDVHTQTRLLPPRLTS